MRALEQGLTSCSVCHKIVELDHSDKRRIAVCPRCDNDVYPRNPNMIQETWALVIASMLFYIPANLLPMMYVETFMGTESDTIMSGVIYFIGSGSYLIGSVIFIASIVVPTIKLFILMYLLISVKKSSTLHKKQRQKLYLLTEIIGRWSMVDVYVVSVMVALVHFGGLTQIKAGMGVNFFLLVVVVTMVAAMRFDPRLIWDAKKKKETNETK